MTAAAGSQYGFDTGKKLSVEFWRRLATGEFVMQQCTTCGRRRFPPTDFCATCHSTGYEWLAVSGRARIHSWTIVHRPPSPEWAAVAPFALVVADLAEGVLVLARLVGDSAEPSVGDDLELVVSQSPDGRPAYSFRRLPLHARVNRVPNGQQGECNG